MADLLHNKLLHSVSFHFSRSPSFCFLLSRSTQPNFCVSRFAPVRRSRLSRSSPVLTNLSADCTRLDIVSVAEQADGSVVFKFGYESENSQSFENVNGGDAQSEVLGVLDDEHGVNHTKSELLGTSIGEREVKFERESANDAELTEVAENDGTGVLSSTYSNEDENYSIEVEHSAQSEVAEDDGIEVENLTERKMEHQRTVLESVPYEGELVGLSDSLAGLQSNGDSVEDEHNHNLISTVEIENSSDSEMAKHDLEANNLAAISDSVVDLVMDNSSDSELVKHDIGSEVLATTSNSIVDLITEKFVEAHERQLVAAVSASQPELDVIELQDVSGNSSSVETLERAVSLEDNEICRNMKPAPNNHMLKIADTNSPVEASDMIESLEDKELESNVKHAANEDDGDNFMLKASDIARSLEEDECDSDAKQVANEENDGDDMLEAAERNSTIEASNIATSLEDDECGNSVGQLASEEHGDIYMLETAETNLPTEASDIAVSLEDDEDDNDLKEVANEEDDDNDTLQTADTNSTFEASDVSVSLVDDEHDSNVGQLADKKHGDSDMLETAPPIIPLSNDVLFGADSSEAAIPEASGLAVAEANVDRVNSAESAPSILYLSSAAASLPRPGEASTGGEDTYFVCQNWFGLADGVGQWSFGGTDRVKYAHELMRNCEKLALNSQGAGLTDIKEVLQQIAATTESSGSARVLIAHFAHQALHVANIGDTGFLIVRNGAIFKKSSPMVHEFNFPYAIGSGIDLLEAVEEYHFELEDGDVIIAATDGLFDNLYEQEVASIVSKSVGAGIEPKELAELLVTKAQEVGSLAHGRSPFADAAKAAGHTGVVGGKLDHVTVVVSLVQTR